MTPEAERIGARIEAAVLISLAGKAAERRALQGSAPGWRRWRTPEELRAHHEAGHAIAQWAHGDSVWKLSIVTDKNIRVGKLGYLGGYCSAGTAQAPPPPNELAERLDCDLRIAADACMRLSLCEPPTGGAARFGLPTGLRARTRDLIDQHWHRIAALAGELVRHQELDQAQIEAILSHGGLGRAASG